MAPKLRIAVDAGAAITITEDEYKKYQKISLKVEPVEAKRATRVLQDATNMWKDPAVKVVAGSDGGNFSVHGARVLGSDIEVTGRSTIELPTVGQVRISTLCLPKRHPHADLCSSWP